MSKAIAIPYIIALILGILVVALVGYWLYRVYWGAPIGEQQCRSTMISWCNSCKTANGFDMTSWEVGSGYDPGTDLTNCASEHYGITLDSTNKCGGTGILDTCKAFIE